MDNNVLDHKSDKEKRGSFLQVLCTLSWIGMGYVLMTTLSIYFNGAQEFRKELNESVNAVSSAWYGGLDEQGMMNMKEMINKSIEYFTEIQILTVASILIAILAVVMMNQLNKNGFFLYMIYTILGPCISLFFLGTNQVIISAVALNSFFGVIFVIMYAVNLKRMTN